MAAVHSLSMKHVLLLDDDREVSCVLLSLLEEERYYVSVCRHVAAACEFLDRVKIDLFIADVLLPDGTVFAAVDAAERHKVPYILMTGSPSHMAQLDANAQFHLSKPFKLGEFLSAVRDRIGPGDASGRN